MTIETINRILTFIVLVLAQALVLNHIHLFGMATPLLYVMFALHFRRNYPRWGVLLWCFGIGLAVDTFSNTPGVAAGSMTLIGLLQPYVMRPFIPRDSADDFEPSIRTMGFSSFFYYMLTLVVVYCIMFFTLEQFAFFSSLQWIGCVIGSIILTTLLIIVIENLRKK